MAAPVLVWLRRELRLDDHPALIAAAARGGPVIPVFVLDESFEALGAAAKLRLERALSAFAEALARAGSRLILRRGPAAEVLNSLIAETGAGALYWTRSYDRREADRDAALKADLKARGFEATSFPGRLLFEPWEIATGQGTPYKVFTPFWRALGGRDPGPPLPPPLRLPAPQHWPASDRLEDWHLGRAMDRAGPALARAARVGEPAARDRLDAFIAQGLAGYAGQRDLLAEDATSGLAEALTWGEISPRRIWDSVSRHGALGGPFLRQLAWRDFAWHLFWDSPDMGVENWRPEWADFPWSEAYDSPEAIAFSRAMTGVDLVDAGLRELWVTGRMHNRARMVVASYLTKNLLIHWRFGLGLFADRLVDWDAANNAMGWQWVAGSGPDASPYFRIFNPDTQAEKFDPTGAYRRRWLAPDSGYFEMAPRSWGLDPAAPRPRPGLSLAQGRARALDAYGRFRA